MQTLGASLSSCISNKFIKNDSLEPLLMPFYLLLLLANCQECHWDSGVCEKWKQDFKGCGISAVFASMDNYAAVLLPFHLNCNNMDGQKGIQTTRWVVMRAIMAKGSSGPLGVRNIFDVSLELLLSSSIQFSGSGAKYWILIVTENFQIVDILLDTLRRYGKLVARNLESLTRKTSDEAYLRQRICFQQFSKSVFGVESEKQIFFKIAEEFVLDGGDNCGFINATAHRWYYQHCPHFAEKKKVALVRC